MKSLLSQAFWWKENHENQLRNKFLGFEDVDKAVNEAAIFESKWHHNEQIKCAKIT